MQHVDALSRIPPRKCKRDACVDCAKRSLNDFPSPSPENGDLAPSNNQISFKQSKGEDSATVISALSTDRDVGPASSLNGACSTNGPLSPNWLDFKSKEELRDLQLKDIDIGIVLQSKENSEKTPREVINQYNQDTKTLYQQWDVLQVKQGILYKEYTTADQTYLTLVTPASIRREIFEHLHTNRISGHFGRDKTTEMIKRRFYWPNISDTVQRWCASCDMCAKCKPGPGVGKSPLKQIKVGRRFQVIALDIFGPLPLSENLMEYIVVIADYFTKFTEAFAIPNHTAQTVADKLVTEVICRYGSPEQIHTDMGREFESGLFKEVCRLLGIKKTRTCPYRPQSDGLVERFNRTLKKMLSIFCAENKRDWDDYLPYIMFAYRSSVHASTQHTPNYLMYGQEINCPIDLMYGPPPDSVEYECPIDYAEWLHSAMRNAFQVTRENLKVAARRQKYYHDLTSSENNFQIGTFVWRFYPPLADQKVEVDWDGPYLIVKNISDLTYTIQKSPTSRQINVHVDHLKAYLGEYGPIPWVGPDGETIHRENIENSTSVPPVETPKEFIPSINEDSKTDEEPRNEPLIELPPLDYESEEEPLEEIPFERWSPVRTRVGRAVKPRQIFSP